MSYTVQATGITKSFGSHLVLDHVDLALETGSIFALLGPNGAGKTTMVRILATLVRPDAGAATIAGHDLLGEPMAVKRSIGLTGQFAAIDDLLTGQENLEMMARLRHVPRRAIPTRVHELLARFDLTDARDRRTATYSGGMKRRLDLAISMIEPPKLLFLDEPTTGLDPRSREHLWGTVRGLVDEGVTVLLTTQYLEEADWLADTVALLDSGRIVAQGTAGELKAGLSAEILRLEFGDRASYEHARGCLDVVCAQHRQRTLDVTTDGSSGDVYQTLGRLAAAGIAAQKVSIHRPTLDEVFISLTDSEPGNPLSKEVA
jgi:ABC-2 type transport system ATP-binding protein